MRPNRTVFAAARTLESMIDAALQAGPLRSQKIEDDFLLAKTAALRKNNESLLSFMSWSGLNPRQIREWKFHRLRDWCERAEKNLADLEPEPSCNTLYFPEPKGA